MTDYFGYDVHFVMNITDIDDKVCIPSLDTAFPIQIMALETCTLLENAPVPTSPRSLVPAP